MHCPAMRRENCINHLIHATLYGILDTGYVKESELEKVASELLKGGVDVLQFRAKGLDSASVIGLLEDTCILEQCHQHAVPLIINDFPDAALALGADGVHLGQDDGSLADARAVVGDALLIGRSTHSPQQARAAHAEGFDYIGYGPLFPTPTKQGRLGIGLETIRSVQHDVGASIPMFCIGGIKPDNLDLVISSGARRVVIVSSLLQSENITAITRNVLEQLQLTL